MAEAPKNKSSQLFSLISSVLLHFTVMLVLFALLRNVKTTVISPEKPSVDLLLIEFDAPAKVQDIDELRSEFLQKYSKHAPELDYVNKEKALSQLSSEDLSSPAINPLRDLLLIKLQGVSPYVLSEIKTYLWGSPMVAGVYQDGIKSSNMQSHNSNQLSKSRGLQLAIGSFLILILPYLWLRIWMDSFMMSSKESYRSLKLYGAEPRYFSSLLRKAVSKTLIKGWLLAVALYFMVIYLFFGGLSLKLGQISITNQFVVLVLPLIISLLISAVLARNPYFRDLET